MLIKNISNTQLAFIGLINGRDLILKPGQTSDSIIPNKDMLNRLINKSENLKLIVHSPDELDLVSTLDSRAVNIIAYEPIKKKDSEEIPEE